MISDNDRERYQLCIDCIEEEIRSMWKKRMPKEDGVERDYEMHKIVSYRICVDSMLTGKWNSFPWENCFVSSKRKEYRVCPWCEYQLEHVALSDSPVGRMER